MPKTIKDGPYVINLDEYADIATHCIELYVKNIEMIYSDSFGVEHVPWKLISKKLSKYIADFDYFEKTLIVLSATIGRISIISFTIVIGDFVGRASEGFTRVLSLTTGILKRLLKRRRNKKKKHNKVVMLAKSKLKQHWNYSISSINRCWN